MKINIFDKQPAPEPPYDGCCVCVTPALLSHIFWGMWLKSERYFWETPDDWRIARQLLAEQAWLMIQPCGKETAAAVDRVYMLLNTTLNGIYYTHSGLGTPEDPLVIDPEIEATPGILEFQPGSMADKLYSAAEALDNLATGNANFRYSDTRNPRQQLEDILAAIQGGGFDDTQIRVLLQAIIIALG